MLNGSVWFANLLSPIFNVLIGSVFAADSVDRGVMIGAAILIQRVSKTSRNIFRVNKSENAALACLFKGIRRIIVADFYTAWYRNGKPVQFIAKLLCQLFNNSRVLFFFLQELNILLV